MKLKILPLICSLCILTGCSRTVEPISQSGFYFNTVISVTLYDSTDTSILDGCFSLCEKYENMLSRTVKGSDIWNINHSNAKPVEVSEETALLLNTALSYCQKTNGKIDITVAPLDDLWDFTSENAAKLPNAFALAKTLEAVSYKNLSVTGRSVTLSNPESAVDLGFIAKGYIADRLKEYLIAQEVQSAVINLGGNVLTLGEKPDGTPFKIGIQKPFDDSNVPITSVLSSDSLQNASVVSSGIYERFVMIEDTLYHHILNPQTGYPYQTDLLGVTILSETSVQGDALSTTCLVLGLKDGLALIESLPGVEAVFITQDYVLHKSSGYSAWED